MRRTALLLVPTMTALLMAACGTNVQYLLLQSGNALGRTWLDLLLTDIANSLASGADDGNTNGNDNDGNSNGNDNGNGNANGNDNGNGGGPITGDPAAGIIVFETNGCGACHCADASGGCALSAPGLAGVTAEEIDAALRGSAPHPTKPSLSDQQIADLAAYFASL